MRIAIVGGGASGTLVAANLLRSTDRTIDVVVYDEREALGRGVAYSTTDPNHLLNVRAKQMSAIVGDPDHFLRFAACGRDDFAPRATYGDYLATVLAEARTSTVANFRHVRAHVTSIERGAEGWSVRSSDGNSTAADVVVLATGNPPPGVPAWASALEGSHRFIADPWEGGALRRITSGHVLAIGTGLTFVDVAISVAAHPDVTVTGISRHGLLPTPHTHVEHPPPLPELHTPRDVLHWLRSQRHQWREAVNGLRTITQELWRGFDDAQKRQFLRHAHRYWEIHRHRIAEPVAHRIEELRTSGRLTVRSAKVLEVRETVDGYDVVTATGTLHADWLVACTGPSESAMLADEPIAGLIRTGAARPGPLGIGLDVHATTGALLDANGAIVRGSYAIGPLRRGVLWESTAIPEIHVQAHDLAGEILTRT